MATETTNLKLNKPDKTDFYNIDLVNANMDKIDEAVAGKADTTHKHNKADISDFPSSLPANGGNADTIGGKSPSEFANASHTHDERYYTETEVDTKLNAKANSSHTHTKADVGLGNVDNTADSAKSVKYATSAGNADTVDGYHAWQQQCLAENGVAYSYWSFLQWNGAMGRFMLQVDGADGTHHRVHVDNADTVDGYHVDLGTNNTYGLKPIAMDTFDLTAGSTPLSAGYIYIMYE